MIHATGIEAEAGVWLIYSWGLEAYIIKSYQYSPPNNIFILATPNE